MCANTAVSSSNLRQPASLWDLNTDYLHRSPDTEDVDYSKHCILGSCTGLLVAAAITVGSCKPSTWVQLAVHIVCIAFRIGVYTASVGDRLTSSNGSWSHTIYGKLDPQLLSKFHQVEVSFLLSPSLSFLGEDL